MIGINTPYLILFFLPTGEKSKDVLTGDDTSFEYKLDTMNDTSSNNSIPEFLIIAQDVIKSIVKEKFKQDYENEIFNLGDYSGLERGTGADHYVDNIRVEDTENALGRGIGDDPYIDNRGIGYDHFIDIIVEDTENALGRGTGADHYVDNIIVEDTENALGRDIEDDPYKDNNRVQYTLNVRWRWFFLAFGISLFIKLAWYLCRKNKRDAKCEVQHVSKK
ncbi:hypothetical protein AVEN_160840-1 [Araneus ventricosus]|uniref:Uncharacterized protein n=1 Tax=Araneus ventricosus TaxID=182803 RepID=A0A4Y2M7J9_ARAVE|nr:hypothetical protein AVEN_160840-1 [Araneus ventricosus]